MKNQDPKIVTDPKLTAETDDLNTDKEIASSDLGAETQKVEEPVDNDYGLNENQADIGLNHDKDDDLSLNMDRD